MELNCPICGSIMKKGLAEIHGTTLGFLLVGFSYENLYFRAENEDEIRILESGCSTQSLRCENCEIVILNKDNLNKTEKINESDFSKLTRTNIFGLITLWSSRELQVENQKNNPEINVIEEMVIQWKDSFAIESEDFRSSFGKRELDLLNQFNEEINKIFKKGTVKILEFVEFVGSPEWLLLNEKAKEILKEIN